MAFLIALADQGAVAVINDRLLTETGQASALRERARLARELHDSVSQALFSMTLHARTAQLTMEKQDLDVAPATEEHLYRLALEALNNTVKHADARTAAITLTVAGARLELAVTDDGVGFDTYGEHPGHLGLRTMHERADALGGTLSVASHPGQGTTVRLVIP